jgi:tRNA-2-methylthio-N6-dimethylallyladenosine synthase
MRWKDDIPEEVKQERLQKLIDLHNEISNEERQQMLGQTVEVLVERFNRDGEYLKGRTRCWKKVIFKGDASLIGTLQPVKVHSYSHQTLVGELENSSLKCVS